MTILDQILEHKRTEVDEAKVACSADEMRQRSLAMTDRPRGFRQALVSGGGVRVIAEVKRRSPSKGLIREDFDPVEIARAYAEAGAAAISVLTDSSFFGGELDYLARIRAAVDRPLLRKDFVIDPYQIDEARVAGADAILLITGALDDRELSGFHRYARDLGLDVLVEVHDEAELDRARSIEADLIGVNNRDLRSFEVDLATTERLAARIGDALTPETATGERRVVLVAESGIATAEDVDRLSRSGATGFLVGESLMRQPDPGKALEALRRPL